MSDRRRDPEEKFGSHLNLKKASDNAAGKIEKTPERSKPLRKLGSFHSLNDFNSTTDMEKGENSIAAQKTSIRGTGM